MSEVQELTVRDKLGLLHACGKASPMGALLRRFWQPVALASQIEPGRARLIKIMGEELAIYRGESGKIHLVGGRCAHRLTYLHTGWIEGESLRCMYHGWKYDASGQCTQAPAETEAFAAKVRIAGYPTHEYCGLVFAYMGEGEPPAFDLPRKREFERENVMLFAREEVWPCNWFQQVENSLDAVHVSFVHHWGKVGSFGQAVSSAVPSLSYEETDAGIKQTAIRSETSKRVSDWTFPNNNHISHPTLRQDDPWVDVGVWMVPHDEGKTSRFILYAIASTDVETDERIKRYFDEVGDYNPANDHDRLLVGLSVPDDPLIQLTSAQDYVAAVGQGTVADRENERLGKSDAGIAFLRRIFWRELETVRAGREGKAWRRNAEAVQMPHQS